MSMVLDVRHVTQMIGVSSNPTLRDLVGEVVGQLVVVAGRTTPQDAGGGDFSWTDDTQADDDGALVVVPTIAPRTGCWKRMFSGPLDVRWFGAKGNRFYQAPDGTWYADQAHTIPAADDADAIQAAVDAIIKKNAMTGSRGSLELPPGNYQITHPIIIGWDPGNTVLSPSIVIQGAARPNGATGGQQSSALLPSYTDRPAIILCGAINCELKRLAICGRNSWANPWDGNTYRQQTGYVAAGVRDNRYSPYAAIAIDPFDTTISANDRYPQLDAYYAASAGKLACTQISMEDVFIDWFVVGIAIGLSGELRNAENIRISNSTIQFCRVGVAVGQDQSRNVRIDNCTLGMGEFAIDTLSYGRQAGDCPSIDGGMAGTCRELLHVGSVGSSIHIRAWHTEGQWSLGALCGGTTSDRWVFDSCSFNFRSPEAGNARTVNYHVANLASATFTGCSFSNTNGDDEPIKILNIGHMTVMDGEFGSNSVAVGQSVVAVSTRREQVAWSNTRMTDHRNPALSRQVCYLTRNLRVSTWSNANGQMLLPGTLVESDGASPWELQWASGTGKLDLQNITFTVVDGVATFTLSGASGFIREGDQIHCLTAHALFSGQYASSQGIVIVGVVQSTNGSTVTLKHVPEVWPENTAITVYGLLHYLPRMHEPTTGSWTAGQAVVTGVTGLGGWAVGQRVRSAGIQEGTFITAIDQGNSTLTLSRNATQTGSGRLYDADMRRVLTDPV